MKISSYILGLDIGTTSAGWAILSSEHGKPVSIVRTGVRIFDAGVEGDISTGRDSSKSAERRKFRLQRRQCLRRKRRMYNLFRKLQNKGLLPSGTQEKVLTELHEQLTEKYKEILPNPHVLSYLLRKKSLDSELTPYETGISLYHLAHRRGFLSNRKSVAKDDDGKVKQGITELCMKMSDCGARTLGEYYTMIDPEEDRIRGKWTSRKMYEDEFEKITTSQKRFLPEVVNDETIEEIRKIIFFQRPLKSQKNRVGFCELEKGKKKCPWYLFEAQRFRILQKINDLEVISPDFTVKKLTQEQKIDLYNELDNRIELSFAKIRKIISISGDKKFNLEKGGEKKLNGNKTAASLIEAIGSEKYHSLDENQKIQLIEDLNSIVSEKSLEKRLSVYWKFNDDEVKKLLNIHLEEGYCSFSKAAVRKLLPELHSGASLQTAVKKIYPDYFSAGKVSELLPPVRSAYPALTNPAVIRSLSEVRRVVNEIVKEYGVPDIIRVELARDLKKSRDERRRISQKNREIEQERTMLKDKIIREAGVTAPSRTDIEKAVLYEECGHICPYTGKAISFNSLFSDSSEFDIEHIIPYSRCLDDSLSNKTLCFNEANRNEKKNRTPFEAFSSDEQRWEEILDRVKRFSGRLKEAKLKRFMMQEAEFDVLAANQLNDTRYASVLAAEFLGNLYGGRVDSDRKTRVQVSTGQITAQIRNSLGMNSILNDGGTKNRDDHRHHAVDAVAIGLASYEHVRKISECSEKSWQLKRKITGQIPVPWNDFLTDLKKSVSEILVSHKVSNRVRGSLHEDTNYSPPRDADGRLSDTGDFVHVRKAVNTITANMIEGIVDPAVKKAVLDKLAELGKNDPAKAFNPEKGILPYLKSRNGKIIPVRKVRIRKKLDVFQIGKEKNIRFVNNEECHHIEIYEKTTGKGIKFDGYVVSLMEAAERLRRGKPLINKEHGPGTRFLFSLAKGEVIEIEDSGLKKLCIVRSIPREKRVYFVGLEHSMQQAELRKQNLWWKKSIDGLMRDLKCRKAVITLLGDFRRAND